MGSVKVPTVLVQRTPEIEAERLTQDVIMTIGLFKWQATRVDEKQSGLDPTFMSNGITIFTPSTQAPWVPNMQTVAPPENTELTKAAKVLVDCLNVLLGSGSASTRELLPLNLHSSGDVPYFDPQPQSLMIAVGASPIGERLYLLEKVQPEAK